MDESLFTAVDRMIVAGGQKLARAVVVGNLAKKPANALLADLEKHGYIRKEGSKFTLTDEGRRDWENRAGEERKRELADRLVAEFLAAVQKQSGKALSAKQRQQFDEGFVNRVKTYGFVVEAGVSKYSLSARGEGFLKERELNEQLKRLRAGVEDLFKAPQTLLQQITRDTECLAATVSAARDHMEAEVGRLRKLEKELRQTADQIRVELEHARQEMGCPAVVVEEKAPAEKSPVSTAGPSPAPSSPTAALPPSEEAIWQATRRAYEQLEKQFKLTSELIKVPNLTDLVRTEIPGLPAERLHDLLQRWQREDRLVLQVCNDPHFEPRSAEGIPSPRGLLFYVDMK
jgi:hypothetical protein